MSLSPPTLVDPLVLTIGRINLDLYGDLIGAPMADQTMFHASVGGSPTNCAIIAARLGVPSAILSAVGTDTAGDLVMRQLAENGVDTRWVSRLDGHSTSLALLATTSADTGERQFYRQDAADMFLPPNAVDQLPWESLRAILISADSLAAGTTPDLAIAVARHARQRGIEVWWDLDWRGNSWATPSSYHTMVAPAVSGADVVIGTEEEFATLLDLTEQPGHQAFTSALAAFPAQTKVLKRGASGATLWTTVPGISVPATAVRPVCTVGGGDSVAGALLRSGVTGIPWAQALSIAMEAAAWTVSRPGCSAGFPTATDLDELRKATA